MGIDVWVAREHVPASPVPLVRLGALALAAASRVRAEAAAAMPPPAPKTAVPKTAPPKTAPPKTASTGAAAAVSAAAGGVSAKPVAAAATPRGPAPAQPQPEFLLCFVDFTHARHDLSCVFYLPYATPGLPPAVSRFADNLAVACFGQATVPQRSELRWPMVKAAHIVQSADEARQVVAARLANCARHILVFGRDALPYLGVDAQSTPGLPVQANGRTVWPVAAVDHYFAGGGAKARLWQTLLSLQSAAATGAGFDS
jgi:hypothetical protein